MLRSSIIILVLVLAGNTMRAKSSDHLNACWKKQVKPLGIQYLSFSFQESNNKFYHSFEPWAIYTSKNSGTVDVNGYCYLKIDSVKSAKKSGINKTKLAGEQLLILKNGDTSLAKVDMGDYYNELQSSARYSPITLLNYFNEHKHNLDKYSKDGFNVFTLPIRKTVAKIYISEVDNTVSQITFLEANDLYGDLLTTYSYYNYTAVGGVAVPLKIRVDKNNGKLKDEVTIANTTIAAENTDRTTVPGKCHWEKEELDIIPDAEVEKYNGNIHFINLKNAASKILVVEFRDFMFVADAPLNSENGECIIKEVEKIAPSKKIKYFAFGHHHPWSLGGMRPFVHKGVTVLSESGDKDYLLYLASAPHSQKPDSLQLQPQKLKIEEIRDSTTITDGTYQLKIYLIGKKSDHTNDYLVFYFPAEKLLFQDDLLWIKKDGKIQKAGSRQAGLYKGIKELNLAVDTIIQSWPLGKYDVKSIVTFSELEQTIN